MTRRYGSLYVEREGIGEKMVIESRQFHSRERGVGNENFYSLARDTETKDVFILHEWSRGKDSDHESGENKIPLHAFLCGHGTSQVSLRDLIGTLLDGAKSE